MKKIIAAGLFSILISSNLHSQDLITDRPDQTESSSVVPKGLVQWESGFSWEFLNADYPNNDDFNYQEMAINSSLFRYGLIDRIELRFGWDYLYQVKRVKSGDEIIYETKGQEFEPVYLGGKYTIIKENGNIPEIAILGHIGIPSLSLIEDAENISPDLTLAGSWTLSSSIGIGFNLGFHWPGFGLGNPNFFYSALIGISHSKKLSTFWEIYGFRHEVLEDLAYYEAGLSSNDFRADLGLTYLLKPNFQLDLSSGLGFSKISPDFFVAIGFSWRIPR